MAENTPVFQFRKPATTDFVSVITDLNDNYDKMEAALVDLNGAHARYYNNAVQTIPDLVRTKVQFPDVGESHAGIAVAGVGNTDFTVPAGLVLIEFTLAFANEAGFKSVGIGASASSLTTWGESSGSGETNLSVSIVRRFSVATPVSVYAFVDVADAGTDTTADNERNHISITRLRD